MRAVIMTARSDRGCPGVWAALGRQDHDQCLRDV